MGKLAAQGPESETESADVDEAEAQCKEHHGSKQPQHNDLNVDARDVDGLEHDRGEALSQRFDQSGDSIQRYAMCGYSGSLGGSRFSFTARWDVQRNRL